MALSTAALTIAGWSGSAVVQEVIRMGFSYMCDNMPADTKAELKRLQTALPQITAVMNIAEALKMKDPSARQWVEQFRQAVEASEDVLDELEYKKLEDMVKGRDEVGGSTSSSKERKKKAVTILEYKKKLEDMVKGRDKVGGSAYCSKERLKRFKEAVTMLDEAAKGVEDLLHAATVLGIHNLSKSWQEAGKDSSRETSSFIVERELFGREVEKHKIIDWLKRPTNARLSSFGIVGVGGLGKTTLAQFAYQEMHESNHFDKTIWVCISTNFSVEDITRKMLTELGENNCDNKPLNALQETLKEKIHLKKILLVLDDIWDDEKRSHWDQLIAPLRFVQNGSKIVFTTRMKSVADLLASVICTEYESLSLQGLGEQELRLLFQSYAFHGFNMDNHRDLLAIGDQILKMLRGSPLAAKVIGSLLNSRMDHQYWTRVLNQGSILQANDVVEVLKLSYYHLPANLQVCFRFCSIFPQDHQFDKDELIKMWICSGFVRQQSSQEERPEDIGEDYFNLLLRKSFFEYVELWNGEKRYVMHDLVHELAQNVSHGECCRLEPNDKSITIPTTVRHVYVHECEMEKVSHLENLRSLIVTTYEITHPYSFVLPNNLIKKSLRLLKISGSRNSEMPKEISCLVHLRYLSMEPHPLIPRSFNYLLLPLVNKLYHLQVLEIPGDNSAIETTGVTNLLGLRYMRLPEEIMQTIHGVHKLTSLQELTFFVGQESGQRIHELGTLKNLRHLFIENIENIGDDNEANNADLLGKKDLMLLSLKWTSTSESIPIHSEKILDSLQPPPSLIKLTINNYNGRRSPKWMGDSTPLDLSSLKLLNCPHWKNQLFSWNIPYLKILDIHDCQNMDKLPDMPFSLIEFRISYVGLTSLPALYQNYGNNTAVPLSLKSSLRVVEIRECPNLIYLHGFLEQDNIDFPSIKEIAVSSCKNVVHLPMGAFGKFVSLQKLNIGNCPMLMAVDKQSTLLPMALKHLSISNCGKLEEPMLESSSSLPTLDTLHIFECKKLVEHSSREQAHGADRGSSLASLKIKELHIDNLSLLLIEPLRSRSFVSYLEVSRSFLSNQEVPEILLEQWFLQNSSTLKRLTLWDGRNLNILPATMVRLTVFEDLSIYGVDLLEELPELPASLRSLYIHDARSLKSLPATMARLTALKRIQIYGVDLLEELPELPTSLRKLIITEASSLKSLPATMARLTALESLLISGANLLEELPELPASLGSLCIGGARSLKSLPATMARLTALYYIDICGADLLEELPELPASLKYKKIKGCGGRLL